MGRRRRLLISRDGQNGFTLLEVLVALIVAALALGILTRGTSAGLAVTVRAGRYEEAVERARSHLASLATSLSPVEDEGDDGGGFRWRHHVAPIATAASALDELRPKRRADAALTLYDVSVGIAWIEDGRARGVTLSTERVGPAVGGP